MLGRAPPPLGPNWTRKEGGPAPLSFSFSLSFLSPFSLLVVPTRNRITILFLVGLHLLGAPQGGGRPPPCSFIYGGRGHPKTHKLNCFSRVRCPPPQNHTSVIPSRSLGEALRR